MVSNVNSAVLPQRPIIIAVGGLTSNVGKTTLLCELLRAFPGWEAIKTTRGHYRSCGKDPHTCCVSDLLESEPVIRSGRELTYSPGKDTGRYWDAGAVNVHWVIATDEQVASGIENAVGRVKAKGVLVEGNSFTEYVQPDFFVMVARPDVLKIKTTARKALNRVSALYFSSEHEGGDAAIKALILQINSEGKIRHLPIFTPRNLPALVSRLRDFSSALETGNLGQTQLEV
ncbi:MAG: hypothetical protein H7Z16_08160 [Pyrinomonadaceae bacterium]|nr:hypothetical protein [Pyrinomonadaceae bacterium]